MRHLLIPVILSVGLLNLETPFATGQSSTALSDVASFQATSSSPIWPNCISGNAVNGGAYWRFEALNTEPNPWWRIDLGKAWEVEKLTLHCRWSDPSGPPRLNGATLMALGPDDYTKVADNWVIEGFRQSTEEGGALYAITIDNGGEGWNGVQYFQIGGIDPTDPFGPSLGVPSLTILEFEAWAQVPVYDTFINGVTATANYTAVHPGVSPTFLVDNSGMDDQSTLLGDPTARHYRVSAENLWVTPDNPSEPPVLTFDLHGIYDLDKIVIWGGDQNEWRQPKECLIEVSTDGETWTALADANAEEAGNYTLTENDLSEYLPLPATDTLDVDAVAASHVRMTLLSIYRPHPTTGATNYGFSEVRFYGTETSITDPIPGDADNSGTVDDGDAKILAAYWGMTGESIVWGRGDFNGDKKVDACDAAILAAHWGATRAGESVVATAVPEPGAFALLLGLLAGVSYLGRGR
ncbi:MAG TPA: hypothetical protein DD670_03405 [Planctomycetaceae bacterium]|nr:hypothetical protein [Planctomycetaceae bacterium]